MAGEQAVPGEATAGSERCDLAVVGGGAAGLAAAIFAAEHARGRGATAGYGSDAEPRAAAAAPRVVVLDGAARIGAKILISGGGRCNVTHEVVRAEDFNGARPVVRNVLAAFDAAATVRWFESLGVSLKREETGKLFPVTDRARTVVDALLARCAALGIEIRTGARVHDVARDGGGEDDGARAERDLPGAEHDTARADDAAPAWRVHSTAGVLAARTVVLATGGRSLPRTGSDGGGYAIVARLGHHITETTPALVPLVLGSPGIGARPAGRGSDASGVAAFRELSGVSQAVELQTFVDAKLADRRTGSLLWTHFGVSGPVVLDASRHFTAARAAGRSAEVRCSVFPGEGFAEIERRLLEAVRARPRVSAARAVAVARTHAAPSEGHAADAGRTLPERVAAALVRAAGGEPGARLAELSRERRRALVHTLAGLVLPVVRDRGWNHAEVTAGGVPLDEIDFRTMESRRRRGLYLVGEILDCDGRIGGFNFQWAWATGFVAGRAIARALATQPNRG